ncbi:MAG: sigma-70 family RNA polymerase sigma factor [Myxococcota bacterium]
MSEDPRDQWLTEVAERWEQPLRDYARRWLRDEALARDVVQETLFRVWRASDVKVGDVQAVRGYAYRVCRNLCIDQLRTRREEIEPDFAPRGVTDRRRASAGASAPSACWRGSPRCPRGSRRSST